MRYVSGDGEAAGSWTGRPNGKFFDYRPLPFKQQGSNSGGIFGNLAKAKTLMRHVNLDYMTSLVDAKRELKPGAPVDKGEGSRSSSAKPGGPVDKEGGGGGGAKPEGGPEGGGSGGAKPSTKPESKFDGAEALQLPENNNEDTFMADAPPAEDAKEAEPEANEGNQLQAVPPKSAEKTRSTKIQAEYKRLEFERHELVRRKQNNEEQNKLDEAKFEHQKQAALEDLKQEEHKQKMKLETLRLEAAKQAAQKSLEVASAQQEAKTSAQLSDRIAASVQQLNDIGRQIAYYEQNIAQITAGGEVTANRIEQGKNKTLTITGAQKDALLLTDTAAANNEAQLQVGRIQNSANSQLAIGAAETGARVTGERQNAVLGTQARVGDIQRQALLTQGRATDQHNVQQAQQNAEAAKLYIGSQQSSAKQVQAIENTIRDSLQMWKEGQKGQAASQIADIAFALTAAPNGSTSPMAIESGASGATTASPGSSSSSSSAPDTRRKFARFEMEKMMETIEKLSKEDEYYDLTAAAETYVAGLSNFCLKNAVGLEDGFTSVAQQVVRKLSGKDGYLAENVREQLQSILKQLKRTRANDFENPGDEVDDGDLGMDDGWPPAEEEEKEKEEGDSPMVSEPDEKSTVPTLQTQALVSIPAASINNTSNIEQVSALAKEYVSKAMKAAATPKEAVAGMNTQLLHTDASATPKGKAFVDEVNKLIGYPARMLVEYKKAGTEEEKNKAALLLYDKLEDKIAPSSSAQNNNQLVLASDRGLNYKLLHQLITTTPPQDVPVVAQMVGAPYVQEYLKHPDRKDALHAQLTERYSLLSKMGSNQNLEVFGKNLALIMRTAGVTAVPDRVGALKLAKAGTRRSLENVGSAPASSNNTNTVKAIEEGKATGVKDSGKKGRLKLKHKKPKVDNQLITS